METDLKYLIEKIKQDGIDRALAESARITDAAKTQADEILGQAAKKSEEIIASAKKEAENFRRSSETALKQAARDALLMLRVRVSEFFARVVKNQVVQELKPDSLKDIILKAVEHSIKQGITDIEVVLNENDKKALEKVLFEALRKEARAKLSLQEKPGIDGGFRIGAKGMGSYVDFTDQAIAEGFRRYLNPKLVDALDIDLGLKQNTPNGK
ncbi:MAG: hypothetical protein PHV77_05410 [Candidatus Omnitrophica bacterium]|nr:hypothetical protein [Candidatus Omnitrophota bacterium]